MFTFKQNFTANLTKVFISSLCLLIIISCGEQNSAMSKKELLIYCGITMVKPISDIAKNFEHTHNIKITISRGGSEDLYQSAKASQKGDIYFPGSISYRKKYFEEGLLEDTTHVGWNQSALVVKKGNPKNVNADPHELLRKDINVIICNPDSGSIGKETKKLLDKLGIFKSVFNKSIYLTTDSHNLNQAINNGEADATINWRATGFFEENKNIVDVIDLDPSIAIPKKLILNLFTFSKNKDLAKTFMIYAASEEGQKIFRQHGFLDNKFKP